MSPRRLHFFQNDVHLEEELDFVLKKKEKKALCYDEWFYFYFGVVEEERGGGIQIRNYIRNKMLTNQCQH